jgi:ubiquinone/menaquinone biosynthesis C-methylase UbiE
VYAKTRQVLSRIRQPLTGDPTLTNLNPQAEQMAAESMVRTLEAQTLAIWPQEQALFKRYALPGLQAAPAILDAGCGTGEGTSRLAELFQRAQVRGIDIVDAHLARARERFAHIGSRLSFEHGDIYQIPAADRSFDLTVCRHVLHAIPHAERVIAELVRVTRPGGYLHLIVEDYGMLYFERGKLDPDILWRAVTDEFARATEIDLSIGRHAFGLLTAAGLQDIAIDYIIVDTVRVPRSTFASMLEAWRDGFVDPIGEMTSLSRAEAVAYFNEMIAQVRDPRRYAVWMVPVASARRPV